jgi:putative tetracenomycin polyketide synthesis O-methyltransferase tcmP
MEKIRIDFSDSVAETLLIPLWMRALESRRADALFHDWLSCSTVDRIDYDFTKFSGDKLSALGVAVRTRFLDEVVERFIDTHDSPVVVLMGCGLDPRFQRVCNSADALCYEIDLPEVIELRERLIPASENDIYVGASILETQWLDDIAGRHPDSSFIFVCEGVLMYFDENRVMSVITSIAERFRGSELWFERLSRFVCRNADRHKSVGKTDARFKWGIDDPTEIERWSPDIRLVDTMYYPDMARSRWGFAGYVMRLIPLLHRSCGVWGYRFM